MNDKHMSDQNMHDEHMCSANPCMTHSNDQSSMHASYTIMCDDESTYQTIRNTHTNNKIHGETVPMLILTGLLLDRIPTKKNLV